MNTDMDILKLIISEQDKEDAEAAAADPNAQAVAPEDEKLDISPDLPLEITEPEEPIMIDQKVDVIVITMFNDETLEKTVAAFDSIIKKLKKAGVVYAVSGVLDAQEFKNAVAAKAAAQPPKTTEIEPNPGEKESAKELNKAQGTETTKKTSAPSGTTTPLV